MEYYVWNSLEDAKYGLEYINNSGWFPIIGYNALTGKLEPDKQITTKWQDLPKLLKDGRWAVTRIPSSRLDDLGVMEEERLLFFAETNPTIEDLIPDDFYIEESSSDSI